MNVLAETVSKSENLSNGTDLKANLQKPVKRLDVVKLKKSLKPHEPKSPQKPVKTLNSQKSARTVEIEKLSMTENVSSDDRNIGYNVGSYTQGRLAGDFLSS